MTEILSVKKHRMYSILFKCPECGTERKRHFSADDSVKERVELVYCDKCRSHFDVEVSI